MIRILGINFTICVEPTKEAMDFYMHGELCYHSEIIKLDIMEDGDSNNYYAYRCYGSVLDYMQLYKKLYQNYSIYLGWD